MNCKYTNIIFTIILIFSLTSIAYAQEEHLAKAIDELINVFDSNGWTSWKIPNAAKDALVAIGPTTIPSLFKSLDHQNPRVRNWCGATLEGIVAKYSQNTKAKMDIPKDIMFKAMKEETYGENAHRLAITLAVRFNGVDAVQPISELLSDDNLKVDAVEALGMIGDGSAVPLIDKVYENGDLPFRESAIRALGNIGDDSAIPILTKAAKDSNASIRKIAIATLGAVGTSAEVPLLTNAMQDEHPEVRNAAEYSLYKMAGKLASGDEREKAIELYKMLFENTDNFQHAGNIADKLKSLGVEVDLKARFGFINTWMAIGPFENEDGKGFDTVYPPEKEIDLTKTYQSMGQEVKWQEITTDDVAGKIDLTKIFAPKENVVAYAMTSLALPEEMDVQIKAGSDDTLTIWLNGVNIHAKNVARGVNPDDDVVGAHLKKGKNTILLKICQGEGGWGYCLRIVDKNGKPVVGQLGD